MHDGNLKVVDGVSVGSWIEPRLTGDDGAVTCEVPSGFDGYARIFHPAIGPGGGPVRWTEVAESLGTTAHPEMQWHALLGFASPEQLCSSYETDGRIGGAGIRSNPATGQMDLTDLDALCEILSYRADRRSRCYFGLSTIQGWQKAFAPEELKRLLRLPAGRDYIILNGSLFAVNEISRDWSKINPNKGKLVARKGYGRAASRPRFDWKVREAPNLIWPADHTWFVASEVDFDSTLVGGSAELIQAVVDSTALEALAIEPTASLMCNADKINRF